MSIIVKEGQIQSVCLHTGSGFQHIDISEILAHKDLAKNPEYCITITTQVTETHNFAEFIEKLEKSEHEAYKELKQKQSFTFKEIPNARTK